MKDDDPPCRVCGCTFEDFSGCLARSGRRCFRCRDDLCSACAVHIRRDRPRPSGPVGPGDRLRKITLLCSHVTFRIEGTLSIVEAQRLLAASEGGLLCPGCERALRAIGPPSPPA